MDPPPVEDEGEWERPVPNTLNIGKEKTSSSWLDVILMFFIFMYFAKPRAEQVSERECVISLKNFEACLNQIILP